MTLKNTRLAIELENEVYSPPLLTTKLTIPPLRSGLVQRPRLHEKLNRALAFPMTLLSAPLGSGKTTVLCEWIQNCPLSATWVSLDEGDNDPVRFWSYIIAALQKFETTIAVNEAMLPLLNETVPETFLTFLINDLARLPEPFVLVLEDYHVIHTPVIHAGITYLLEHLPWQMHVILTTQADPPLPLGRWRARNLLGELRGEDLRFSFQETGQFLNQQMHLGLSPESIGALEDRTEGWIAGLQLGALSLQNCPNSPDPLLSFTGSNRFILEYLIEEVLQRQPAPIQAFLLNTSFLDRLNTSLCDAVLKRSDSRAVLDTLDRGNLFLIPIDGEGGWYRYHHLFVDVLRRLAEARHDEIAGLQRLASDWFEGQGLLPEAVHYALAAQDWEHAAQLVDLAAESLRRRGELSTIRGWIEAFPESARLALPGLCLIQARLLAETGQYTAGAELVDAAERAMQDQAPDEKISTILSGRALALRSQFAAAQGKFTLAIELAHGAQERLKQDTAGWRSFAMLNLAGAYRFTSSWSAACEMYQQAGLLSQSIGDSVGALMAFSQRGEVLQAQGSLRQAVEQYEQVLELAQSWGVLNAPVTGYAFVGLGRAWCEWNDLTTALHYTEEGLKRGIQADNIDVLLRAYMALARIQQANGAWERAQAALDKAGSAAQRMGLAEVMDWVAATRAGYLLAEGQPDAAIQWARGYTGRAQDAVFPAVPAVLAHIWLLQNRADEAVRILDHALASARSVGRLGNAAQILAVKALAHRAQGDPEQALAALAESLALAEPQSYTRIYVDEGKPMARLLKRMAMREPGSSYLRGLLETLGEAAPVEPPMAVPILDPISPREQEIARLIADGATNQEIARELTIAVNTVKKHISNIFSKLGVSNRVQAVARMREMNLI